MGILESIDQWGRVSPDRVAHASDDRRLTYGELLAQSDALAGHLIETLGSDRSPVAVIGHKEPEMLVAFLGAVKSGRPYVPIDTSIPEQRIAAIVQNAGAALSLTPASVQAAISSARPQPLRPVRGEDPHYIIFTSGSTGEPKGVVITANCLAAFVGWMCAEQKFQPGAETFLNQAPFSFDLSVMDLYLSLVTGGTLWSVTKNSVENPKRLYESFAASGLTTWVSTPSFASMCLVERTFAQPMLPRLRRFLFCGETLPNETAAQLLARFPDAEVWNTYGPTEATVATTSVRVDARVVADFPTLPVGYAIPGTRIEIAGENGGAVAEGERGEIVIVGPNVSPGYLGRPDLTAKAFSASGATRAYRTGDWGRIREGLLFFEGRIDGQIKLHGYRIELGDLEANLRALAQVSDAVVLPVEKRGKLDSLAAFVVLRESDGDSEFERASRLKRQLAERLPAYMVPRKFVFLETFPMTANGKADRRQLATLLT